MKLPRHIKHWDDERKIGNGIIVTLQYGYSFYSGEHLGVMGFDTASEAIQRTKLMEVHPCMCDLCLTGGK